jgi:cytochrome c-type biogenesis protein CcmH/NrfF
LGSAHVEYQAHHWLLLAGPAFLPAVIVVGVVLYVAIKDRRSPESDQQASADDQRD